MSKRIFNFSAGPATLPLSVLETARDEFLNYKNEGMSLMEMSHRSKTFDAVMVETEALLREVGGFSDDYQALCLQGGATGQFAALALNLCGEGQSADYITTGAWAVKALKEAKQLGKQVNEIASSAESNHNHIPGEFSVNPNAAYLHICSNNTIFGTQWQDFPDTGEVPLIADMSSDLYCKRFDPNKFGMIYAGSQKNAGPAGVALVIIRKDLLERSPSNIPTIFNYKAFAEKNSMLNTPNTYGIYIVNLVMKWIRDQGGVDAVEAVNRRKAGKLYDVLDSSDFFSPHAQKDSRSLMNITWRLPNPDLEAKFVAEALENDMSGLKGHRSVGGIRASIYNAMPEKGVETLIDFMKEFERRNG